MSNQEAIALLRNLEDALDSYCELNEEGKTAFRMAIEALSCSENPNNSDCISRQAAIDATWFEPSYTDPLNVLTEVRDRLKALPSAQPEVIRCRDCKWFGDIGCAIRIVDDSDKPTENDFCSYAERREE